MHIPLRTLFNGASYRVDQLSAASLHSPSAYASPTSGSWSSIIGIVSALIGNVLISFALNTQRYAHIRLEREAHGQDPRTSEHRHAPGQAAEDHQTRRQSKLADALSKRNKQSEPEYEDGHIYTDNYHDHDDANETEPLLAKVKGDVERATTSADGHDEKDGSEPREKQNYLRSKLWWLGISLMVVGEAGNFLAYGFAPASVVSPLGVVALIVNCLIAPLMLHEKFRKRDLLGVALAIGGAVAVVLSAQGSNPKLGPKQIWSLISRWEFLTYFGITVACILLFMVLSNRYGDKTIVLDIGLVGLFGGYTALSTKGVASLLSYRFFLVLTFPIFYLLLAILVGTAIMQIKYVNRALQHFSSTQVIPTQFCAFTVSVVAGSAILYRDFETMPAEKIGQFFGGVALTFLGVWIITSGREDAGDEESTHGEQEEEEAADQEISMIDDEDPAVPQTRATPATPSPPSTPKAAQGAESPTSDSPASFATATTGLTPMPSLNKHSQKPPMTTTKSTPYLPSEESTPLNLSRTVSSQQGQHLSVPKTPNAQRPKSPQHAYTSYPSSTPSDSQTPDTITSSAPRRQLLSRNSITGMIPGPYTSPLSSGFGAVVADSRRRDERGQTLRRKRSQRTSVPQQPPQASLRAMARSVPDGADDDGDGAVDDARPRESAPAAVGGVRPRLGSAAHISERTQVVEEAPEREAGASR